MIRFIRMDEGEHMSIKLVAVDMDGTFLNRASTYDVQRFLHVYQQMKDRGIRFVVASGNPLKQLKGTFEGMSEELTYIADNGGYIVEEEQELFLSNLSKADCVHIIEAMKQMPDVLCWTCTKDQSYTLSSISDHYFQMFLPYFPGVKKIDDFLMIKEDIIKFALYLPDGNVEERIKDFIEIVSEQVRVVDSGHDCVDLISRKTNKGTALQFLMERYGIEKEEVMAFGDAGNDEEMLKHAGYGYAMENAKDSFKEMFTYIAPSNENQGVLEVLETYLEKGTFYNQKTTV